MRYAPQCVDEVRTFDAFTADNDPHGEHDFGSFEVDGRKIFWKLDYYDAAMRLGSEDPADPAKTTRVSLTIMLASSVDHSPCTKCAGLYSQQSMFGLVINLEFFEK